MTRLFARGSDGVVCIHTGSDNVVDTPTADLSRVLFHSSLQYPSVIATLTATISLPAVSTNQARNVVHTVGAHGRAGTPFVLGYLSNVGNLPLAGHVPLDLSSGGFGRWVILGANATDVILDEYTLTSTTVSLSARDIDVVVLVTDLLL